MLTIKVHKLCMRYAIFYFFICIYYNSEVSHMKMKSPQDSEDVMGANDIRNGNIFVTVAKRQFNLNKIQPQF